MLTNFDFFWRSGVRVADQIRFSVRGKLYHVILCYLLFLVRIRVRYPLLLIVAC